MFRSTGPIFAAVRLDKTATEVLRQAVDLAKNYKVKLYACHILPDLMSVSPLFPQLQLDNALRSAEFEAEAQRRLAARVGAFITPEGDDCEILIEYGTEHSAIIKAAERVGAGLIVVGHGSQKHSLSGVAERVVRYAHCPVLVARPPDKGCVLAATDFSDPASPAIEAAASEAVRRGRELTIIHAYTTEQFIASPDGVTPAMFPPHFAEEMRRALQDRLDASVHRVSATKGILVHNSADVAILEAIEELPVDLVVVGTHGRTGLSRLALGSVAEAVVRKAGCSILVVRLKTKCSSSFILDPEFFFLSSLFYRSLPVIRERPDFNSSTRCFHNQPDPRRFLSAATGSEEGVRRFRHRNRVR
jgi:nucleotide-binding universal stress UspA family protein